MSIRQWNGGELRLARWTNEWVIVAPARALRSREATGACPFCPGLGEDTPPEHWRLSTPDGPGWRVRAVTNRYALSDHHEVMIESPRHGWDLTTAATSEVVVFRNKGEAAGSSLPHPHSQVLGLPVLSGVTVHASTGATAFVPTAPAAEFEMRVVPRTYRADFGAATPDELVAVADSLRAVLAAMRTALGDPAYNLVLHTADDLAHGAVPGVAPARPRLSTPAGLEVATGIPVLTTRPEDRATRLRAALPVDAVR